MFLKILELSGKRSAKQSSFHWVCEIASLGIAQRLREDIINQPMPSQYPLSLLAQGHCRVLQGRIKKSRGPGKIRMRGP